MNPRIRGKEMRIPQEFGLMRHQILRESFLTAVAIAISMTILLPTSLETFPFVDGMQYFPLAQDQLLPYRDYFLPVPPMQQWISSAVGQGSYSILEYRLVSWALWTPLFAVGIYATVRKFAGPGLGLLSVFMATVILGNLAKEPIGGWNTTAIVGAVAGCSGLIWSWSTFAREESGRSTKLIAAFLGVLAGVVIGFAALAKQTLFASTLIAIALFMVLGFCAPRLQKLKPGMNRAIGCLLIGLLIPVILAVAWASYNNVLYSMFRSLGTSGGKNPTGSSAVANFSSSWIASIAISSAVTGGLILFVSLALFLRIDFCAGRYPLRERIVKAVALASTIVLSALALYLCMDVAYASGQIFLEYAALVFLLSFFLLPLLSRLSISRRNSILLSFTAIAPILLLAYSNSWSWIATAKSIRQPLGLFIAGAACFTILALVVMLGLSGGVRLRSRPPTQLVHRIQGDGIVISSIVLTGFLVGTWVTDSQSTGGLAARVAWLLPGSVLLFSCLIGYCKSRTENRNLWRGIQAALAFLGIIGLGTYLASPYVWNDWVEPPLVGVARSTMNQGSIHGLHLAESSATFYRELDAAINQAGAISESEQPVVFSFPLGASAYSVGDMTPYVGTYCFLHWIDICPDSVIAADLVRFIGNPSNVIVWMSTPESTLAYQEATFNAGRSAMRDWDLLRQRRVSEGAWLAVREFKAGPGLPIGNDVTVYAVLPSALQVENAFETVAAAFQGEVWSSKGRNSGEISLGPGAHQLVISSRTAMTVSGTARFRIAGPSCVIATVESEATRASIDLASSNIVTLNTTYTVSPMRPRQWAFVFDDSACDQGQAIPRITVGLHL